MNERLQKVLAAVGLASRREIERWITAGRITVNRKPAQLGMRVGDDDVIALDGKRVHLGKNKKACRVLLYNKPEGQVSTRRDPDKRPTVYDRIPDKRERWMSVGRLDINTTGLLLFTNDGDLTHALTHPSTGIDREYAVRVRGDIDEALLQRLRDGVILEDGFARFTDIQPGRDATGANKWFYVVLMEGKNREVRRLWESQGVEVSRLKRVRFGNIFMPSSLQAGQYMELPPEDVNALRELAGLPAQAIDSAPSSKRPARRNRRQVKRGRRTSSR